MIGLSRGEIQNKIQSELSSLTVVSQNSELKSLATRITEGVAKAMEANNRQIERQLEGAGVRIS